MATQETQILDDIIVAGRRKMLALGGSALAGMVLGTAVPKAAAQSATYSDSDILNFALNLEYLEANFYYMAAFGTTINVPNAASMAAFIAAGGSSAQAAMPIPITITGGGVGTPGTVTGGSKVIFGATGTAVQSYATETAIEEGKHVVLLQNALGSLAVNQPAINIAAGNGGTGTGLSGAFGILANAAGIPGGNAFSPYASDQNFLVGAYVFEDVGVTAYHGAASLITMSANLSAAASILAVEAYHAGLVRTTINALDPTATTIGSYTQKISSLRASLALAASPTTLTGAAANPYDTNPDDYGTPTTSVTLAGVTGNTATQITDADRTNVIAFSRNTNQVLNIVTGGGKVNGTTVNPTATGVFFPNGLNAGSNGFK
jgi:hypothetical protein